MTFSELQLLPPLLRAVKDAGYTQPSPIQAQAIPPVLSGRDLLGCAQTGTGKTAAFALPILHHLQQLPYTKGARPIRALVLTPTRELALQIDESFQLYSKYLPLRTAVIFGGVGQGPQVQQLRRGVDILTATPGRLNDLTSQGYVNLSSLSVFVLDEADRMLDMGFAQDVKKIIRNIPKKRQTLLFSATMPKEIAELANKLLNNPVQVYITPPSTTVEVIEQSLYRVDKANKRRLLADILKSDKDIVSALVFTRTKHGADRVVRELKRDGITALAIHGNKSQTARQSALARFKDGRAKVLVATDIAARGLDISELSHVFNYDLPNVPETYVHRIGRTGRAGKAGIAISFCSADELEYLADIEKAIGLSLPKSEHPRWPVQDTDSGETIAPQAKASPRGKNEKIKQKKPAKTTSATSKPTTSEKKDAVSANSTQPNLAKQNRKDTKSSAKMPAAKNRQADVQPNQNIGHNKGSTIVTKRPVWAKDTAEPPAPVANEGEQDMSRNNNRRRKKRSGPRPDSPTPEAKAPLPTIPKDERGIFNFSEDELAGDDSIRLISTTTSENKYANFEDYLKDH